MSWNEVSLAGGSPAGQSGPLLGVTVGSPESAWLAYASGQMKSGKLTVFDSQLSNLYLQAKGIFALAPLVADLPHSTQTISGQTFVNIDVTARNGDGASLLPALSAAGLQGATAFKGVVSGSIAVSQLPELQSVLGGAADGKADDIGFAHASGFMVKSGVVDTQADVALHADTARASYAVDGTGVKIGVLSDSFDTDTTASTHMADDIASGDLGADTTILEDTPSGTDEGRGMAQIIHDLAPGASIEFATAYGGQAHFASNILALAADGAKVIVDDIIYYNELAYQDGPIAQAIDQVAADGVTYFSAAGNDSNGTKVTGYEGAWTSGAGYDGGGEHTTLMQFAPGQDYIPVKLGQDEVFVLQWANPGASAGGSGATADLDLFLTNQDGSVVYGSAETGNIGGDPVEVLSISGGTGETYYLRVGLFNGAAPPEIKLMALGNGANVSFTSPASNTNTGTFFGHAAAEGGMGVAAAFFKSTPAFGKTPPVLEGYSSGGPDHIWFDTAGNLLSSPEDRGVDLTSVDGGNTTFFGQDTSQDADSFPNFFGTSAAAPGAAAIAALMLQARGDLTPDDIHNLLQDSALHMGSVAGLDPRAGAGLIDAGKAAGYAQTLAIASSQTNILGTHFGDTITASAAATIHGGDGDDTLSAAANGAAFLYGDAGDDILVGSSKADTLDGGSGVNTASYANASAGVTVSLLLAGAQNTVGAGKDTLTGIQNLTGSAFNDTLQGDGGDNVLNGGGGTNTVSYAGALSGVSVDLSIAGPQDTIGAGHDTLSNVQNLTGSAFADTLAGTSGNNVIDGGGGIDTVSYAGAGSGVTVSLATTLAQATGGAGTDTIRNVENLTGSGFDDTLVGSTLANILMGGGGQDHLTGGGKADILWGGADADTFVYTALADSTAKSAGQDQIMDFSHAEGDRIDLSAIDAITGGGDDAFTLVGGFTHHAGELIQLTKPGGFLVEGDVDGDGKADFGILVHTGAALTSGDFVL